MHDVSLASLGLYSADHNHQHHSGFPSDRITCGALHASTDRPKDIGAFGRYSSEDRCGAQLNGSILPVPSHRMWLLFLPLNFD